MNGFQAFAKYILPPVVVVICLFFFVMTNQSINFAARLVISTMTPAAIAIGYVVVLMIGNRRKG